MRNKRKKSGRGSQKTTSRPTTPDASPWVQREIQATLLEDTHLGSGAGGGLVDAQVARDHRDRPVIWSSHLKGIIRDSAHTRRLREKAQSLLGRPGVGGSRVKLTSLYLKSSAPVSTRVWRSSARESFDNRAPAADTLRAIEYIPAGTKFLGKVELKQEDIDLFNTLLSQVESIGARKVTGAGRVQLKLCRRFIHVDLASDASPKRSAPRPHVSSTRRVRLCFQNLDPLCQPSTASTGNLIATGRYIPGRIFLAACAAWLHTEGCTEVAELVTSGQLRFGDALPVPKSEIIDEKNLGTADISPAPLALRTNKPKGDTGDTPWWAKSSEVEYFDGFTPNTEQKLKRARPHLMVYRQGNGPWKTYIPMCSLRLRSGRSSESQPDPSLFSVEAMVEETQFIIDIQGSDSDVGKLESALRPVLEGRRWLSLGRGGTPVKIQYQVDMPKPTAPNETQREVYLTLCSDLLLRDENLLWISHLSSEDLSKIFPSEVGIKIDEESFQEPTEVRAFNGTSRLWRRPAAGIRRGSVFRIRARDLTSIQSCAPLGERTHEGFGQFRLDAELPGSGPSPSAIHTASGNTTNFESICTLTREWHKSYEERLGDKPSKSQWFQLLADLERYNKDDPCQRDPIQSKRIDDLPKGQEAWRSAPAKMILTKLSEQDASVRALYADYFVRWLKTSKETNRV